MKWEALKEAVVFQFCLTAMAVTMVGIVASPAMAWVGAGMLLVSMFFMIKTA
jgi:hypothetical protein